MTACRWLGFCGGGGRTGINLAIVAHLRADELLTLAAQWLTLWLGLSLLGRRPRSAANTLAAAAFLVVSAYLLSVVFLLTPESGRADLFWDRWLSNWAFLAPVFLLHAFLSLTGTRLPRQRLVLALLYAAAAAIVATGIWGSWFFIYRIPLGAGVNAKGFFVPGRLEFLQWLQALGTFALALVVLVRARRATPAAVRSQLTLLIAGTILVLLGGSLMFVNAHIGSLPFESLLQSVGLLGGLLIAMPFVHYRGLLEGQLLRSDLKASLAGTCLLMSVYLALMVAVGAPGELVAGLGWFVLSIFVLSDDVRALVDRAFYGAASRASRAGLRTAASYAGAPETLDLASLSPGQSAEMVEYLGALDRASFASARLEGPRDQRVTLLAAPEFASVRSALGLAPSWTAADGVSLTHVRERVLADLKPRERQALGLKYLGYSDREMAGLMGVRLGVPRSYLGSAKHNLGLSAGASLMLFVHFSGLVASDALPLLARAPGGAPLPAEATQLQPSASAEELV